MRKVGWIALTVVALCSLPAAAQQDERGPITWLAFSHVKPGKTEDAVELALEQEELMDRLVAEDTVLSWGLGTPINHNPGDTWNFVEWVTVGSWSDIDAWAGAVMARMNAASEEERAEMNERFQRIYVDGSHFDEVVRHAVFGGNDEAVPRYFYVADFRAKAGRGRDMVEFFKDGVVPLLEPMVADGTLTSYGVASPELHIVADWTHRFWYGLPSLGAIDTLTKTFADAQTPAFDAWAEALFAPEGHFDKVLMVLHFSN